MTISKYARESGIDIIEICNTNDMSMKKLCEIYKTDIVRFNKLAGLM